MVKLTFEAFKLEFAAGCGYDDVSVYEGNSATSPLLKRFCGDSLPKPVKSKTNTVFVQFLTDDETGFRGFKASVTFENPPGEFTRK